MSSIGGGLKLTPRTRLYPTQTPSKLSPDDDRLQLTLKAVIGTTTSSPNGFKSDSYRHMFAYCAGPAVIVSQVQEDLIIRQRLYRARLNAPPVNTTPSFYNPATPPTTPTRSRAISPLKEANHFNGLNGYQEYTIENSGSSKIQNRTREATCLSLSRNFDLLAVGETGHNPRVLLFSVAPDALTDVPLSVLTDHSFGVQSVAFSPDSKWVCSLGNTYDGFLLLYSVNPKNGAARLHSSNKCSNVNALVWMGNAVVSYGTRHVKIWRIEQVNSSKKARSGIDLPAQSIASPGPKILSGRNCILGCLIDAVFTSAIAVTDYELILGTLKGDVCLLDDANNQRLDIVARVPFAIQCVYCDHDNDLIWVAGDHHGLQSFRLEQLRSQRSSCDSLESDLSVSQDSGFVAMGKVRDRLVMVTSDRVVDIRSFAPGISELLWAVINPLFAILVPGRFFSLLNVFTHSADDSESSYRQDSISQTTLIKSLPAHESPVLGACILERWSKSSKADFLTYSARGTALFWKIDGTCVGRIDISLEQDSDHSSSERNELKAVVAFETEELLLAADKMGILQLIDRSGSVLRKVQAHQGDINSIITAKSEPTDLICTCGRDRTLQVFRKMDHDITLIQTLDDHAASVTDARFWDCAASLISISSDRTILVRRAAFGEDQALAFLPLRVITLKASPVSFTLVPFDPNVVLVSTMDRQIQKFDISTGRLLRAFKPSDPLSNDSVLLSALHATMVHCADGPICVILAISSTDKSIRLHDYDNGTLLAREHGQVAVSSVKLFQERSGEDESNNILSCGHDGTVIVYNLNTAPLQRYESPCDSPIRAESPLRQTPNAMKPLRKTLTRSEIAEFQKTLDETQGDTLTPIRSPSPSRVRQRTSRYNLAPRATQPTPMALNNQSSPGATTKRRTSQDHTPKNASPQNTVKAPKPRPRPSLDNRRRSKSAANLNDLNMSGGHICESLRTFRKRLASSVADKLKTDTRKELQSELELTIIAMADAIDEGDNVPALPKKSGDGAFDTYLARMIDQRLELKTKMKENQSPITGARPKALSDDQAQAGANQDLT